MAYLSNERGTGPGSGRLWGTAIGAAVGVVVTVATGGFGAGVTPTLIGLGASIGGTVGGLAGTLYDTMTAPDTVMQQDQLSRIFLQDSGYGQAIPQVFQRYRLAGNVIWLGEKLRHEHREVGEPAGGKDMGGGPENVQITYTYTVSLAVLLCDTRLSGPMAGISKIWADGTVIYDNTVHATFPEAWRFYEGTATQAPDPTIEADKGEQTPAYRYRCYIVGTDVDLGALGRVPNYTFEVYQNDTTTPLLGLGRNPVTGHLQTLDVVPVLQGRNPETLELDGARVVLAAPGPLLEGGNVAVEVSPGQQTWVATSDAYTLWRVSATNVVTSWPVHITLAGNIVFVGEVAWTAGVHYEHQTGHLVRADGGTPSLAPIPAAEYYRLAAWATGVACVGLSTPSTLSLFTAAGGAAGSATLADQAWDVVYHPAGHLWVPGAESATLNRYSLAGTLLNTSPTVGFPMHLTVASDGAVWVAGTLEVARHDPTTGAITVRESFATSTQGGAGSDVLVPGRDGYVWVVDWPNSRLGHIGPSGEVELVRLPAFPIHLVPDPTDGGVYFVSTQAQQVGKVDHDLRTHFEPAPYNLPGVLQTLCVAAGVPAEAVDVSLVPNEPVLLGLMNVEAVRIPVEMLCRAHQLLPIESNGQLRFVPRSQVVEAASIPEEDLLATEESGSQGARVMRLPELEMPTAVQVLYIDPQQSYQQNTQRATITPALEEAARPNERTVNALIGMTADQAKRLAQENMDRVHLERTSVSFAVTRKYARVEPGDVVQVQIRGLTYPILVTEVAYGRPGLVRCKGTVNSSAVLDGWVPQPGRPPSHDQPPIYIALTTPLFLHLPALGPQDMASRYHVVYESTGRSWRSASLWRATDVADYTRIDVSTLQGITGTASLLAPWNPALLDDVNTVTVRLTHGQLRNIPDSALLDGGNLGVIGQELFQFGRAELTATRTYTLSRLLRGRRGTEHLVTSHVEGERFVLLDAGARLLPLPLAERGVAANYKAVSRGQSLAEGEAVSHTPDAANLRPWSVSDPQAERSGNDWHLTWYHRARFNSLWTSDNAEIVADSDVTGYQVRIWDGSTVVRTQAVPLGADVRDQVTWVYTSAMQTTDFGSPQTTLTWSVRQKGTYAWGQETLMTSSA